MQFGGEFGDLGEGVDLGLLEHADEQHVDGDSEQGHKHLAHAHVRELRETVLD